MVNGFVQMMVMLYSIVLPIVFMIYLFVLWVAPMGPKAHYFMFVSGQTLLLWQIGGSF